MVRTAEEAHAGWGLGRSVKRDVEGGEKSGLQGYLNSFFSGVASCVDKPAPARPMSPSHLPFADEPARTSPPLSQTERRKIIEEQAQDNLFAINYLHSDKEPEDDSGEMAG